jgi:hypothetical protein
VGQSRRMAARKASAPADRISLRLPFKRKQIIDGGTPDSLDSSACFIPVRAIKARSSLANLLMAMILSYENKIRNRNFCSEIDFS